MAKAKKSTAEVKESVKNTKSIKVMDNTISEAKLLKLTEGLEFVTINNTKYLGRVKSTKTGQTVTGIVIKEGMTFSDSVKAYFRADHLNEMLPVKTGIYSQIESNPFTEEQKIIVRTLCMTSAYNAGKALAKLQAAAM